MRASWGEHKETLPMSADFFCCSHLFWEPLCVQSAIKRCSFTQRVWLQERLHFGWVGCSHQECLSRRERVSLKKFLSRRERERESARLRHQMPMLLHWVPSEPDLLLHGVWWGFIGSQRVVGTWFGMVVRWPLPWVMRRCVPSMRLGHGSLVGAWMLFDGDCWGVAWVGDQCESTSWLNPHSSLAWGSVGLTFWTCLPIVPWPPDSLVRWQVDVIPVVFQNDYGFQIWVTRCCYALPYVCGKQDSWNL